MAVELRIDSIDQAFRVFDSAASDRNVFEYLGLSIDDADVDAEGWPQIEIFEFGDWVGHHVKIIEKMHSEINGPFLDAYARINNDLQRLYALVKYGNADVRNLTQDDLDYFQIKVKVSDGSSEYLDNAKELLEKLGKATIGKMSGKQAVITIVGLALVAGGTFGTKVYLDNRKEVRLEEIRSEERKAALSAIEFSTKALSERFKEVSEVMKNNSEYSSRALSVALNTQNELLRAASKTGEVVISDNHLNRAESKELSSNKRRSSQTKILEQEFKVVGGNTSDAIHTQIVLEDTVSGKQIKVVFRDRFIAERKRAQVFNALENRATAWIRLQVKEVEGEIVDAEILDVPDRPDPVATSSIGRK